jgi:hypothetical protein
MVAGQLAGRGRMLGAKQKEGKASPWTLKNGSCNNLDTDFGSWTQDFASVG